MLHWINDVGVIVLSWMHVRDSCLSLKEMSTNAEKETLYMQYGQLLLFQWYLLYDEEFENTKGR